MAAPRPRPRPIRRVDHPRDGAPVFVMRRDGAHLPSSAAVTHAYAVLAFHTGGRSIVEQGGRWTLRAGDALLVPAGQPHRTIASEARALWGLGFCVSCFAADADAATLLEPFERVRAGASAVVHVPDDRHAHLIGLFRELEAAGTRGASHAVHRSLLTLVLDEIARAADWHTDAAAPAGVVVDALRFIERNCLRPLTLAAVARAVGKSPAYVTTALARATGRSAVAWIIAGRMAEARRLLRHSDEHVDVIAERVGYADPTHFIRLFRREHGATPAAWRAAISPRS